jgi:hypothetical protein
MVNNLGELVVQRNGLYESNRTKLKGSLHIGALAVMSGFCAGLGIEVVASSGEPIGLLIAVAGSGVSVLTGAAWASQMNEYLDNRENLAAMDEAIKSRRPVLFDHEDRPNSAQT